MFKKPIILLIFCFFLLTVTTSLIKNKSRNLERDIFQLKKDVSLLEKQINDAEIDYTYLSNPEQLTEHISTFKNKEYSNFDRSRIFYSIEHFNQHNSKESKYLFKGISKE
tara:strand:- start:14 stop:343 length:330 start_codon:yes stop_codon:yes gene_type:complete